MQGAQGTKGKRANGTGEKRTQATQSNKKGIRQNAKALFATAFTGKKRKKGGVGVLRGKEKKTLSLEKKPTSVGQVTR